MLVAGEMKEAVKLIEKVEKEIVELAGGDEKVIDFSDYQGGLKRPPVP